MKVSEYIKKLEDLKNEHGDLDVYSYWVDALCEASEPRVREIRKKRPRERKEYYLNSWDSDPVEKKVIHV